MSEKLAQPDSSKVMVFDAVDSYLSSRSLRYTAHDPERPWGGFFVIDPTDTEHFIDNYFPELSREEISRGAELSPKILIVEPGKRLSWQYHNRREELWKVIQGPVGVIISHDDEQGPVQSLDTGKTVQFGTEVRHRLIGLDDWGVIAEIWQHTNPLNPSHEDDIVRVSDDFGR